jgi:hypothetical protein
MTPHPKKKRKTKSIQTKMHLDPKNRLPFHHSNPPSLVQKTLVR